MMFVETFKSLEKGIPFSPSVSFRSQFRPAKNIRDYLGSYFSYNIFGTVSCIHKKT